MPETKVQALTGEPIPEATVSFLNLKGPTNGRQIALIRDVPSPDEIIPWRRWDPLPPKMQLDSTGLDPEEAAIITEAETSDNC